MKLRKELYLFVIGLFMLTVNITKAQTPTPTPNPVVTENELKGSDKWKIPCTGTGCAGQLPALSREIEGYASHTSINKGSSTPITFYVNLSDGSTTFSMHFYRMGWYQGKGARLIFERNNIAGKHQPLSQSDSGTGLLECNWTLGPAADGNYQWSVPSTVVSGVYLVKLISANNNASYIIFTVRDDARASDILFQTSDTTWQAYNYYPGNRDTPPNPFPPNSPDPIETFTSSYSGMSLYQLGFGRSLPPGVKQGRKVSFNRPYLPDNFRIELSAGQFFNWEYNMVRWLEQNGYDVSYISNVDTHTATDLTNGIFAPTRHKLFLSVGHDEYYSWDMRDNLEQARNRSTNPMNLGFFSANTSFWQIRFDKSSATNTAPADTDNRTIIAYKEYARNPTAAAADPYFNDDAPGANQDLTNNYKITNRWRDNLSVNPGTCPTSGLGCYKQPEDELIGVQYSYLFNQIWTQDSNDSGGVCSYGFCSAVGDLTIPATNCPVWLCSGMTQNLGGYYNLGSLIGYEADRKFRDYTGRTLRIIGNSEVFNPNDIFAGYTGYNSHLTFFAMSGGGKVFASGTIQYSWGLDDYSPVNYQTQAPYHDVLTNANAQTFTTNMLNQCLLSSSACSF